MGRPKIDKVARAQEFFNSDPPITGDGVSECLYCTTRVKAQNKCRAHYEMWLLFTSERKVSRTEYPSDEVLKEMATKFCFQRELAMELGITRESLRDYLSIRPELRKDIVEILGANKEEKRVGLSESRRRWRQKNPDKVREINRRWAKNQAPEKRARWNHYNRERRLHAGASLQGPDDLYYAALIRNDPCSYCLAPRSGTIDHIIPVASGGTSVWENLTGACNSCNSSKNDNSLLMFLLSRPSPDTTV